LYRWLVLRNEGPPASAFEVRFVFSSVGARHALPARATCAKRAINLQPMQLLDFDVEGATQQAVLARRADLLSVFLGLTLVLVGNR